MECAFAVQSHRPGGGSAVGFRETYNDPDRRFTLKSKRKRRPGASNRDTGS